MDLSTWWPQLQQASRDWLIAHNGEVLSRSVVDDITRVVGPVPSGAWWVGTAGRDGVHLSDAAVDWIEDVANGESPGQHRHEAVDDGSSTQNVTRHGVTEPGHRGDELTALMGFLQRQRELVIWKVGGVDDSVLRSASTPSGLTAHGVVRHLTNVERSWVRDVFAGQQGLRFDWTDADPDGELHVPEGVTMTELVADYAAETARCDAVMAAHSLDDVSAQRGFALRWIILHLVEETARHLGHLDLLREHADGRTGEEPTD